MVLAIAVVYTPIFARVVRGPVLALKEREFVEASRALGAPAVRIVGRHILPNLASVLVVQTSIALSWAILTEASLSFLGLSAQPPTPSWGAMLNEGRQNLELAPHLAVFPGLAIMLAVLGFNLLGDGLRDALDPRQHRESPHRPPAPAPEARPRPRAPARGPLPLFESGPPDGATSPPSRPSWPRHPSSRATARLAARRSPRSRGAARRATA